MKFFHLSDLHIGLRLINRDLSEDQKYIMDRIVELASQEQPDAIVIAGDIYDRAVPSAEAVELFDYFVSALTQAVPGAELMMISGNHDSAPRVNVFRSVLRHQHIHMIGQPPQHAEEHIEKVVLRDRHGDVNFYLLPFVKPSMVKEIVGQAENGNNLSYDESVHRLIAREQIDPAQRNVLVSHQFYIPKGKTAADVDRMDSEVLTVGNVDEVKADVLDAFDYAALGHIHKPMQVGSDRYRYAGTPLACSVSEAGQQKGIIVVEMGEKGEVQTRVLPLIPLRQIRVITGTRNEVLLQGCRDYVRVVLTDKKDLDVLDMQDRIRSAFSYLLEIRREGLRRADYHTGVQSEAELDPFELCCTFLGELDDDEKALLQEVINQVRAAE